MKKVLALFLSLLFVGTSVSAEQIGVCTHMGLGDTYANSINVESAKGTDVKWIRDESRWNNMQSVVDGNVTIRTKDLDYIRMVDAAGINQLLILAYGNKAYHSESDATMPRPSDTNYYADWLNYVTYTVNQVKDYVDAYEVWNEPNIEYFNYDLLGTAEDYAQLYLDTKAIIDNLDPTAIVLCGSITAVSMEEKQYGKDIFAYIASKGDVNTLIDGFSIHQYTNDVDGDYVDSLNEWESIFDSYGFTGEVWMTENGISANTGNNTEAQQAAYIAKVGVQWENYLKNSGRKGVNFWYDLRNDGTDANEYEHNFGLVDYAYNPKESFYSMKAYNTLTKDKTFEALTRVTTGGSALFGYKYGYVAKYSGETSDTYIIYDSNNKGKTTNVMLSGDIAHVYDYKGNITETINNPSGSKEITMSSTPVYVECVEYKSGITKVDYNTENGIVDIAGTYNNGENVTIEILKDNVVVSTQTAVVTDGEFSKWFSFGGIGAHTVRVAYPELTAIGKADGWAEATLNLAEATENPAFDVNTQVAYNAASRKVTVSGKITDYVSDQDVTILAIPYTMDVNNVDINAAAYVKQVPAINGNFTTEFTVPEYFDTKMAIYLGGTGIETTLLKATDIPEGEYLYVASLDINKGNVLSATALVRNFTETEKKATIILAQYDDVKCLKHVSIEEKTVPAKTYTAIECSVSGVSIEGDATEAKAYIWSDLTDLVPLSEIDIVSLK